MLKLRKAQIIQNIANPEWGDFVVLREYHKNIFEIRSNRGVRILNQDEAKFWKETTNV